MLMSISIDKSNDSNGEKGSLGEVLIGQTLGYAR